MLLRQVARVGLKVEYGQRVERYFEDEAANVAGVVTEDGSVRVAQLVVAADAFKTRSDLLLREITFPRDQVACPCIERRCRRS
jgi:glycine/D-amino acid oxidase-like deaminating enzyme